MTNVRMILVALAAILAVSCQKEIMIEPLAKKMMLTIQTRKNYLSLLINMSSR